MNFFSNSIQVSGAGGIASISPNKHCARYSLPCAFSIFIHKGESTMKQTTNIYFLVDCSCAFGGESSQIAQKAIVKAQRALHCTRFPTEVSMHLIGYNERAMFLNAFGNFPTAGKPVLKEGLQMLKAVIGYQRKYASRQTRSVFFLYTSGKASGSWVKALQELYSCPEFAKGLRYVITPQPCLEKGQELYLNFADFPERVLPYFSENRLCSLIQTITINR